MNYTTKYLFLFTLGIAVLISTSNIAESDCGTCRHKTYWKDYCSGGNCSHTKYAGRFACCDIDTYGGPGPCNSINDPSPFGETYNLYNLPNCTPAPCTTPGTIYDVHCHWTEECSNISVVSRYMECCEIQLPMAGTFTPANTSVCAS